jgi:hypothetical protein
MGWQPIHSIRGKSAEPLLSVYADWQVWINAVADRAFFAEADAVTVDVDPARSVLALAPAEADADGAYSLTRQQSAGAKAQLRAPFRTLGLAPGALADTHYCRLERRDGQAVADCSPLLAAAGVETPASDAEGDAERSDGESSATPEGGEAADEAASIADLATQADVASVHDLAERLDCEPDRARTQAMVAGVYNRLSDAPDEGGSRRDNT